MVMEKQDAPYHNINKNILYYRFTCARCNTIPLIAKISNCCQKIFCINCASIFPTCHNCTNINNFLYDNEFVNDVLSILKYQCHCGVEMIIKDAQLHIDQCKLTLLKCPVANCRFEGTQNQYVRHILNDHQSILLANHQKLFTQHIPNNSRREYECANCGSYYVKPEHDEPICTICSIHL